MCMCAIIRLPDSSEMYNSFPGAHFKANEVLFEF